MQPVVAVCVFQQLPHVSLLKCGVKAVVVVADAAVGREEPLAGKAAHTDG